MSVNADHLRLLHGLQLVRPRLEGVRTTVSRHVEAAARVLASSRAALASMRAAGTGMVSAAAPFWEHDLLMAALVARGHRIDVDHRDRPHLVIDGVHATFHEAAAFHRGRVTLSGIQASGALNQPDARHD